MPYALAVGTLVFVWMTVRHINGRRAPYLIGLLVVGLVVGGVVEYRWRAMENRYSVVTRDLLDRDDTYVVCERVSGAWFNPWNRAGYVKWTRDGSKPDRADLTWDTCRALREWEGSGRTPRNREQITAVHVLTHEAMHLNGHYGEAEAECYAMQHDAEVAQRLGATPDNADALATSYWNEMYPRMRTEYVSGDCKPMGLLDQSPGDGLWP